MPREIEPSPRPAPGLSYILLAALAFPVQAASIEAVDPPSRSASWRPRFEVRTLEEPGGVAFDGNGSMYVAESRGHRISVIDRAGRVARRFGRLGHGAGELDRPRGIAVGPDGSLYVADSGNSRIEVFSRDGKVVRTWGKRGLGPGELLDPTGIAVSASRVFVTDRSAARVQVFDLTGSFLFYVWSHGHKPGQLGAPAGVAVGDAGAFYVSDSENCRIQKYDASGKPSLGWGDRGGQPGLLSEPRGIAWSGGTLYVADANNERVQIFDGEGRLLRAWQPQGGRPTQVAVSSDGRSLALCDELEDLCRVFDAAQADDVSLPETAAKPHFGPVAACSQGLLLVSDRSSGALALLDLQERPARAAGVLAGFGFEASEVVRAVGADLDRARGSVLVSDVGSGRLLLFEVRPGQENDPRFVKSVSFDPEALGPRLAERHLDPPGVAPGAIARAPGGEIFLADHASSRIVVLDRTLGVVRSFGGPGDEDGRFVEPSGLAWSASRGALYVVDSQRRRVQAFDPRGELLAAWGRRGARAGELEDPTGIAVGPDGSVYVVDRALRRVLRFDSGGRLRKSWGGTHGVLRRPESILVDDRGRIVVIDPGGDRIAVFTPEGKLDSSYGPELLARAVAMRPPAVADPVAAAGESSDGFSAPVRSNDGTFLVRYRTDPSPIRLNEPFSMDVLVLEAGDPPAPPRAVSLDVGARMRAHGHGMSQVPKVRAVWEGRVPGSLASYALEDPALGNGRYHVRGMLFHMPGTWTVDFDLTRWEITERAQIDLRLD